MNTELDDEDRKIIAERFAKFSTVTALRVGDFVDFADGITRRISYIWNEENIQTSRAGLHEASYYFGDGYVSMGNGSLYLPVPGTSLTLTNEARPGWIWIFHHNIRQARNGVDAQIDFRVYRCSLNAPEC